MKLDENAFNKFVFDVIDNYSNRYEVYFGGGGSGKSYGAVSKIILKSCSFVRKVLFIRKVKNSMVHSIYSLAKEILSSIFCDIDMSFTENKTDFTITLSNGSVFIFRGLDDAEKLKSINGITDIVIEEATEISFEDFTQLDIRLRPSEKFPQIFLMFNPVSKTNWCYKHWFLKKHDDALVIHTTYKDNKFLSDEYRKTLENLIYSNPNYYKIYCLGQFATLDKLVFDNFECRDIDEDLSSYKEFVGLDFGYVNDPTAIVYGRYSGDIIYILKEFYQKGLLNSDIYKEICKMNFKNYLIIADSAEKKSIDELRKMGLNIKPSKKGNGSILDDINFLLAKKIVISKKCRQTLEEFENYTWKKDKVTGFYENIPNDKDNHLIDALRYGLQGATDIKSHKNSLKIIKEY